MQIPILNGTYTSEAPDIRVAYPRNMQPVPVQSGISNGYLRPAEGIVSAGSAPGMDRGGINWNGRHYRVMGTSLVEVQSDGAVMVLGDVGAGGYVTLDYSFDYLAIASGGNLFYWDGASLQQVTDPDLGFVLDVIWIDGYFMTTDGEFLVVTELNDPFSVLPTKYGSSEIDPDPVEALLKLKNEAYALNRYTIEVFDNVGGSGFPFQRIDGAQIEKGTVGTHTCCVFVDAIAFMGSGRNEAISVYLAASGTAVRIATREIELQLKNYTESELTQAKIEDRIDNGHQLLYIHLPDKTLVYDAAASAAVGQPVWFILSSSLVESIYRGRNLVWVYDKWWVGDTSAMAVGYLSDSVSEHWGKMVAWEFNTGIVYNESNGAIFHELELVCLTGRNALNTDSTIWTQYSLDGESWSMPKSIKTGTIGNRKKRLIWLFQGSMENFRIQRFRGTSDAQIAPVRLEARLEALAW